MGPAKGRGVDTRTRDRAGSVRGTRRIRRRTAVALAAVLAGGVLLPLAPYAAAHPVYPSAHQVARSRQAVRAKAGEVGRIEAQLAAADAEQRRLDIAAAAAFEAYNGAVYR